MEINYKKIKLKNYLAQSVGLEPTTFSFVGCYSSIELRLHKTLFNKK